MMLKILLLLGVAAAALVSSGVITAVVLFVSNLAGIHLITAVGYAHGLAPLGVIVGIILFDRFFIIKELK